MEDGKDIFHCDKLANEGAQSSIVGKVGHTTQRAGKHKPTITQHVLYSQKEMEL